jgi:hypothetical protein
MVMSKKSLPSATPSVPSPSATIPKTPTPQATDILDVKKLLDVLSAFKNGDFLVRMPLDYTGLAGKIADTLNEIINIKKRMGEELTRVSREVGKELTITHKSLYTIGDKIVSVISSPVPNEGEGACEKSDFVVPSKARDLGH